MHKINRTTRQSGYTYRNEHHGFIMGETSKGGCDTKHVGTKRPGTITCQVATSLLSESVSHGLWDFSIPQVHVEQVAHLICFNWPQLTHPTDF